MRYYEARSTIAASAEAVWAVLIDGPSWPKWGSGVDAVEGRIAMGETLKIRSQAAPGRAFPVKVTLFDPPARLRFSGGMPLIWRSMPDLGPSFQRFATGLKQRVESDG